MTQPPPWPDPPAAGDTAGGQLPPSSTDTPPATPAPPLQATQSYGAPPPPAQPLYPGTSYGAPQAGQPGYGYGHPYQPANRTNGMAIASMVVSIASIPGLCVYGFGGFLGLVGAILGHVARRQIRTRYEEGAGMALAGIIVGWIGTGLAVITSTLVVILFIMTINDPAFQSELF
jgi:hypothetical protein